MTTTTTYTTTIRTTDESTHIEASSIEDAAGIALRRLYGQSVTVARVSGDAGKSGIFAAYQDGNKIGSEVHVR